MCRRANHVQVSLVERLPLRSARGTHDEMEGSRLAALLNATRDLLAPLHSEAPVHGGTSGASVHSSPTPGHGPIHSGGAGDSSTAGSSLGALSLRVSSAGAFSTAKVEGGLLDTEGGPAVRGPRDTEGSARDAVGGSALSPRDTEGPSAVSSAAPESAWRTGGGAEPSGQVRVDCDMDTIARIIHI